MWLTFNNQWHLKRIQRLWLCCRSSFFYRSLIGSNADNIIIATLTRTGVIIIHILLVVRSYPLQIPIHLFQGRSAMGIAVLSSDGRKAILVGVLIRAIKAQHSIWRRCCNRCYNLGTDGIFCTCRNGAGIVVKRPSCGISNKKWGEHASEHNFNDGKLME